MAYDQQLADRFREAVCNEDGISEKRMMGGVCFLKNGHMIGGADRSKDGQSRFMFRVGKDRHVAASKRPEAQPMMQGGRIMTGLFFVDAKTCDDAMLEEWLTVALEHASSLPPKT